VPLKKIQTEGVGWEIPSLLDACFCGSRNEGVAKKLLRGKRNRAPGQMGEERYQPEGGKRTPLRRPVRKVKEMEMPLGKRRRQRGEERG